MAKRKHGEAFVLEQYENALTNVKTQPQIKASMAEVGYDDTVIAQGDQLLQETKSAVNPNQLEDDETKASYQNFSTIENKLDDLYRIDRKKAKVIFKEDQLTREKLGINGTIPNAYVPWLQKVENFYSTASKDTDIQSWHAWPSLPNGSIRETNWWPISNPPVPITSAKEGSRRMLPKRKMPLSPLSTTG